jgi:glycosyltransferase involved in cell wall biosynthesis
MAAGLAVVAGDVPACREVLGDGRWGKLATAGASEALAQALIESLLSPTGADSDARRAALQQYVPTRMMAGYLAAVS